MTATERRQEILNTISTEGSVRASDLAERLNVTTETIRKDLIFLNNKHLLKKGHGGFPKTGRPPWAEKNGTGKSPSRLLFFRKRRAYWIGSPLAFFSAISRMASL